MLNHNLEALITYSDAIKCLYYNGIATSSDISGCTGKSIPYVNKVLTDLKNAGLIEERGLAISTGGRKPLNYSLVANTYYILSVAIDQFSSQMVFVDMSNNFSGEVEINEFDLHELTEEQLFVSINNFINNAPLKKSNILGIGLTMPGFVDPEKGENYTYSQFFDPSVVEYLEEKLRLPVFLENDSTAIALAEQHFGVAADVKNVMVINLGWGIGLGMILNNQIFRGNNGLAGEFSHIPLFKNGKLCTCGKHGCLETEASLIVITNNAKQGVAEGKTTSLANYPEITADAIISEATKGDVFSVKLLSEAAYHVGEGLAILIHLINPRIIVLSGKGSIVGKLWLAPIQQAINEHCIPRLTHFTEIKISNLNVKAQLIGGAALVIENLGKPLEDKLRAIEAITTNKIY